MHTSGIYAVLDCCCRALLLRYSYVSKFASIASRTAAGIADEAVVGVSAPLAFVGVSAARLPIPDDFSASSCGAVSFCKSI